MSAQGSASTGATTRWRHGAAVTSAVLVALVALAVGTALGRGDVALLALAPAVWAALALHRAKHVPSPEQVALRTAAREGEAPDRPVTALTASAPGEMVQIVMRNEHAHTIRMVLPHDRARAEITASAWHSGPSDLVVARGWALDADGALETEDSCAPITQRWFVAPAAQPLPSLPPSPRLSGPHGAHEGRRPGTGGEFRDIHPYAAGDELRRVDWRATARLARSPGELFVRRTNTLSDASTVLVLDTADDLSERVDLWGASTPHPAQTSLDIARTAALSLAEAVCGAGDRVSLIELALHGRVVRSGTGRRQAARIANALSMISQRDDSVRLLRMPPFPHGSTVYLLSTFFDGDAARLALDWSASGHRVIGVDTLPPPVLDELTEPQRIAYRLVAAERAETLRDMAGAGVTIVNWPQASAQLRAMSMVHR